MKLNLKEIKKAEIDNRAVSLFNIRKERQYLYVKIRKYYPKLVFYVPIRLVGGKNRFMAFISQEDYDFIKTTRKKKEENNKTMKRSFMGRPYSFCKDCDMKEMCTLDYPCEKREEYLKKKQFAKTVEGDDRFWKNGVPKKRLVLCQSAKYMYAHKKTAGQCQEDKCSFYVAGKCELGLDKE